MRDNFKQKHWFFENDTDESKGSLRYGKRLYRTNQNT